MSGSRQARDGNDKEKVDKAMCGSLIAIATQYVALPN